MRYLNLLKPASYLAGFFNGIYFISVVIIEIYGDVYDSTKLSYFVFVLKKYYLI